MDLLSDLIETFNRVLIKRLNYCVIINLCLKKLTLKKVPLVIFKREKEIARKLEFQGLWIAEQPSDDDLRSHWDKLVLSTRTFPDMYWDKFVKKKVKTKYQEQFDLQQLSKLLGLNAQQDEYKFGQASKAAEAAAKAKESQESAGLFSK